MTTRLDSAVSTHLDLNVTTIWIRKNRRFYRQDERLLYTIF